MTKLYLIDLTNLNIINQIEIEQIETILFFNGYIFAGGKSGDEVKIFQYKLKEEEKTLEKISELKLKNIIDGVSEILFFKYGKYPTLYISQRHSSNNCPINIYCYHNEKSKIFNILLRGTFISFNSIFTKIIIL